MQFFDYVYYKCCQFYDRGNKIKSTGISGLALLSLFQFFNLISIFASSLKLVHYNSTINKFWFVIPAVVLMILNGIRYNKTNYPDLKERWKNENEIIKKKKSAFVLLYIIATVFFALAVIVWRSTA